MTPNERTKPRDAEACLTRICQELREALAEVDMQDFDACELPDAEIAAICLDAIHDLWEDI